VSNNDNKYRRNKNLWRKSYPMGGNRRPPVLVQFFDEITETSYSLDLQRTTRHRDYFEIDYTTGIILNPEVIFGEYDEDLIHFNNEDFRAFNYNFSFSSTPYLVFSMEGEATTVENTDNLNIFGISKTVSGAIVGLSAPFSGTIRYRAGYASVFPAYFTGSIGSIAPTVGTFRASFGSTNPNGQGFLTASWAPLSSTPTSVFQTPFDDNGNFDANVAVVSSSSTLTAGTLVSDISAPISNSIYYLAVE